jgi:hypothetical protein|tara:strand:+ start:417 stop:587 length:171 start_codon:yes stop_codon:yes gene_type:complete
VFVFSTFRDERFGAEAIESVDDDGLQTPKKEDYFRAHERGFAPDDDARSDWFDRHR